MWLISRRSGRIRLLKINGTKAAATRQVDAKTGKPFVDIVLEEAGSKGTGV